MLDKQKTLEGIAKLRRKHTMMVDAYDGDYIHDIIRDTAKFDEAVYDYMQSLTQWVSCDENVPQDGDWVNVFDGHNVTFGYYDFDDDAWWGMNGVRIYPIKWQPLPSAPLSPNTDSNE